MQHFPLQLDKGRHKAVLFEGRLRLAAIALYGSAAPLASTLLQHT